MSENQVIDYRSAGVDTEQQNLAMQGLTYWIERSFGLRAGEVKLPLGYFANVIDVGAGIGLAISTDGVGTKILVAQMLGKFDTIGIDCVAMNVNDVLCVGATPRTLVDYIAVQMPVPSLIGDLSKGLYTGAERAGVTIPGGEIAQIKEMIQGVREGYAFDLVGTCVGTVPLDRILTGRKAKPGDVIVGFRSSGVHSNGLSLARLIFFDRLGWKPDHYVPELGRSIGEELLEPTRIYVKEILAMLNAGLRLKALAHITSTGFLNLSRGFAPVGYRLHSLPEPHPIFRVIQSCGNIPDEEMFLTYNMGIGFCAVVDPDDVDSVRRIAREHHLESHCIGDILPDPEKRVEIPTRKLVGKGERFYRA